MRLKDVYSGQFIPLSLSDRRYSLHCVLVCVCVCVDVAPRACMFPCLSTRPNAADMALTMESKGCVQHTSAVHMQHASPSIFILCILCVFVCAVLNQW